jgi:ferritin
VALSKTVQDALNEQMKQEFYAAYLYLSMSAYCSSSNFGGFAKWLRLQATEEVGHAMRIYDYLEDRGGRVMLQAIPQPATEFPSILNVFEQARDHERKVTGMINRLYELVDQEKDYAGFSSGFSASKSKRKSRARRLSSRSGSRATTPAPC